MTINIKGFSLVELMIAMVIGLFLTLGLFTMFRMSATNVATTSHFNRLQESGRIALNLLERDIRLAGYFGFHTNSDLTPGVGTTAIAQDDCVGLGTDNASYPTSANYRTIWGFTVGDGSSITCLTNGASNDVGTDVIQIKRAGDAVNVANVRGQDNHFIGFDNNSIEFFRGEDGVPASLTVDAQFAQFVHHVYYIETTDNIPTLERRELINNNMDTSGNTNQVLMDGIENMYFLYGIDNNGDFAVDAYQPASDVSDDAWNRNGQRIIAVKIYLLVRSIEPDNQYTNDITYNLGGKELGPFNDSFRRKVVSTTVVLFNNMQT